MAFAYSNNGKSFRMVEPGWDLDAGEILFESEPTEGELLASFPGFGTPDVPLEITAWQGLTILNQYGLYENVKAYVDALPDDETGTQAKIDFYRASVWRRDWGWLNSVAKGQFSMNDDQINEMFVAASAL